MNGRMQVPNGSRGSCSATSRKFLNSGWTPLVGHLSQGLERKSSSMQKKEKEGVRQGERAGGSDREEKRKKQ